VVFFVRRRYTLKMAISIAVVVDVLASVPLQHRV
jgi:hypothetical protein